MSEVTLYTVSQEPAAAAAASEEAEEAEGTPGAGAPRFLQSALV